MKTHEHDIETRSIALASWLKGDSFHAISKQTGLPYSTIRNIILKFEKTGSVKNKIRSGCPQKLNAENLEMLKQDVLKDRESRTMSLAGISTKLNNTLVTPVSQTTVRRALKGQGIKCYAAAKKPFISLVNAEKRVAWCEARLNWTAEDFGKICWSDESSIEVQGTGTRRVTVRRLEGERYLPECLAPSFKSGRQTIMVWGCTHGNRLGPLALCPEGKMDAIKYCNVLEEHLLPFWNSLDNDSIFMDDGAPCHTAKYSKKWKADHGICSMDWPAQSPDLNPIENIWQQLKTAVEKRSSPARNKEELMNALQEEWVKLQEKNSLDVLIKSMPKRVRQVIASKGMPTKY